MVQGFLHSYREIVLVALRNKDAGPGGHVVLDFLYRAAGITGCNAARGMDECPYFWPPCF
jgi:hypothetical protein